MSLAEDGDGPVQAPETWTLKDTGGNELGAEIPPRSGDWARSGDVVGVSMQGDDKYWLGLIRSMHAEPGHGMHANIVILSREPQAVQLRLVIEQDEANAFTENAARQFAFNSVRAIIRVGRFRRVAKGELAAATRALEGGPRLRGHGRGDAASPPQPAAPAARRRLRARVVRVGFHIAVTRPPLRRRLEEFPDLVRGVDVPVGMAEQAPAVRGGMRDAVAAALDGVERDTAFADRGP